MTDERELPRGRLGRLARLATVGARTGANLILRRESPDAARHAAEVLGTLRGLATKVGQMVSYVDGVLPEESRDTYEHWMAGLQAAAPRSAPAAIRHLVEEELGGPLDRLFGSFEEVPLASASIGQVHRATLPDGREVAVKVQHPGVAEALEADLRNAGLLETALGAMAGFRRFDSQRVLEEVRARFREELDYRLEADNQRRFAALYAGEPRVQVPEVFAERSARRVLTTALVAGLRLDEARTRPEPERRAWAETLWHFVYKATLVGGLFNADPHPGNYFFGPEGRVAFLDFGCVQRLTEGHQRKARALHLAAHVHDTGAFEAATRAMLELRGGAYEARALAYVRLAFEPLWQRPFRITRPYAGRLVDDMKQLVVDFRKGVDDGYVPLPPGTFFLNRLQFGFYSVLARLDAEVDYTAVEQRFLGGPLA